jgi:hypothetical protein
MGRTGSPHRRRNAGVVTLAVVLLAVVADSAARLIDPTDGHHGDGAIVVVPARAVVVGQLRPAASGSGADRTLASVVERPSAPTARARTASIALTTVDPQVPSTSTMVTPGPADPASPPGPAGPLSATPAMLGVEVPAPSTPARGSLPVTGTSPLILLAAGAAFVVSGAVVMRLARRQEDDD